MAAKTAPTDETTEVLDTLDPVATEVLIAIGEGDDRIVFVQKPLSFFGKVEFFSIAGKAIESILKDGTTIAELFDGPALDTSAPLANAASDADVYVRAFSRVVQNAPEILSDLYCVILRVPRGQREYIAPRIEEELTDDQAADILDTFIDQNWEVMVSFFKERILPLADKIGTKVRG